jgi:hypothetical protein
MNVEDAPRAQSDLERIGDHSRSTYGLKPPQRSIFGKFCKFPVRAYPVGVLHRQF